MTALALIAASLLAPPPGASAQPPTATRTYYRVTYVTDANGTVREVYTLVAEVPPRTIPAVQGRRVEK